MPQSARQRTDNVLTMPALESPTTMAIASGVPEGDIARRAFELYCDRGREDGHDVDDWLNAERELRDASIFGRVSIELTVNTFLDQRVLERLRAEYLEMPGLKLTIEQVQRLCGIEPAMCKPVLDALVKVRFLRLNSDGTYVRSTEGSPSLPPPAKAPLKSRPFVTTSRRAS